MSKKIIIPYFPKGLKFTTPLIFVGALLLFINHFLFWPIVLTVLCIVILTTNYVTEIDLEKRRYSDYLSLVGIRLNEEASTFKHLDRIVITKGNYSQNIQTRAQSRQMNWTDYTCTLLMDGNKTLDLLTRTDKSELVMGVKDLAEFLEVGVEDRCTSHHYWIDLKKI